jgi:hypothetical protein
LRIEGGVLAGIDLPALIDERNRSAQLLCA